MMDWSFNEHYPPARRWPWTWPRRSTRRRSRSRRPGEVHPDRRAGRLGASRGAAARGEGAQACRAGLKAKTITHICYGDFDVIYPALLDLPVDMIDLEMANSGYDLLERFRAASVHEGDRLRRARRALPPDRDQGGGEGGDPERAGGAQARADVRRSRLRAEDPHRRGGVCEARSDGGRRPGDPGREGDRGGAGATADRFEIGGSVRLTIDRAAPPPTPPTAKPIAIALVAVVLIASPHRLAARGPDVRVASAEAVGGAPGARPSRCSPRTGTSSRGGARRSRPRWAGAWPPCTWPRGACARGRCWACAATTSRPLRCRTRRLRSRRRAPLTWRPRRAPGRPRWSRGSEWRLLGRGLVSRSEYDEAGGARQGRRRAGEERRAAIESARSRLSARGRVGETFIRAPFSGAVLRKEAEVGEIVSPIPSSGGLTRGAIVTMADLTTLEVDVDVNEGYVSRTCDGMRAEITLDAYPRPLPGPGVQIVPTADRQKATVQVKVAFDSLDARVLPSGGQGDVLRPTPRPAPGGATTVPRPYGPGGGRARARRARGGVRGRRGRASRARWRPVRRTDRV